MKEQCVIIFNGEKDYEIKKDLFFQDPTIQDLSPTEVVGLYHSTAVYYDVLKEISNLIISGVVKHVNDTKVDEEYVKKVEEGLGFLELMVNDIFGEDVASQILEQAQISIDKNKDH
jgi:hypothetical protein